MAEFGNLIINLLLVSACAAIGLALVSVGRSRGALLFAARKCVRITAILSSSAVVALCFALVSSDFSLRYVQQHSDRPMPTFYKLTALWGGQEGSLLIWVWILALLSAWVVGRFGERYRALLPGVIVVSMSVLAFFSVLMALMSNPFDRFLVEPPTHGEGLTPLLQNLFMVTHPPALYVGFVGLSLPFAFAVAASLQRKSDPAQWLRAIRIVTVLSWLMLSVGLLLGMLWAYEELGWGGYWGWDPVENAGLWPWLSATAMLHFALAAEKRRLFHRTTVVLAALTFVLTVIGTFVTRSGFIESVHAFQRSNIGWYFLAFIVLIIVAAALVVAFRFKALGTGQHIGSLLSREAAFALAGVLFLLTLAFVLVCTFLPTLSTLFGTKVSLSPAFFNHWITPLGIGLLLLLAVCPALDWRRTPGRAFLRRLIPAAITAITVAFALLALGMRGVAPMAVISLSAATIVGACARIARAAAKRRKRPPAGRPVSLWGAVFHDLRGLGAQVIHIGTAIMFFGFAGDAFKVQSELAMHKGDRATVGRYTLRFDGMELSSDAQKQMQTAKLSVYKDGQPLGTVDPARWTFFRRPDQPTSEVGVLRAIGEDLFIVFAGFDPDQQVAAIKGIINPLVSWVWIGFVVMAAGTPFLLIPRRRSAKDDDDDELAPLPAPAVAASAEVRP